MTQNSEKRYLQAIGARILEGVAPSMGLKEELKGHAQSKLGRIACLDNIVFAGELPKTLSGKTMRRLLRDMVDGRGPGDTTALADPNVMQALNRDYAHQGSAAASSQV